MFLALGLGIDFKCFDFVGIWRGIERLQFLLQSIAALLRLLQLFFDMLNTAIFDLCRLMCPMKVAIE